MISDHERKTLREIQRQLNIDDPELEQSFRALETTPESTPESALASATRLRRVHTVVIVISVFLGVVMALAGSVGGVLAFAIVAVSVGFARHCLAGDPHV